MQINARTTHFGTLILYSLTLVVCAYILTIAGTFSGVVTISLARLSLIMLSGGVAIWASAALLFAPRNRGHWSVLGPALAVWLFAYAISTLSAPTSRALMGTWYAGFYAGFWLILSDLRSRGLPAFWIVDALLFSSAPLMLVATVQVWDWFPAWWSLRDLPVAFMPPRPSATLGNANALGTILAASMPLALVRARYGIRRFHRVIWRAYSVYALAILYLTTSRGAWLATAIGLALLVALWQYKERRAVRLLSRARLIFAGLVIVGAVLLLVFTAQAFQTPRRDLGPRLGFLRTALETAAEHPLTGSGPFTFGLQLQEQISIPPIQPHAHAHNLVMNVAAELGAIGLVALMVTLGLSLYYAWQRLLEQSTPVSFSQHAGYCAAAAAIAVHCLFDMTIMMPAVMLFALAILNVCVQPDRAEPSPRAVRRDRLRPVIFGATLIALWASLLIAGWRWLGVYEKYIQGELALLDGDFAAGADWLAQASRDRPEMALYWAETGFAAGLAASNGDENLLEQGIEAYDRALDLEPSHATWWVNQAALLWQSGAQAEAIEGMRHATELAPDFADFWLNLGLYYESADMSEEARAAYTQVLDLQPDWGYAEIWQASDLRRAFVADYPLEPTRFMRAQALAGVGEWDDAVDLLKTRIDHDPAQPAPYIQIAQLYAQGGRPEAAVRYLNAARLLVHTDYDAAWIMYVDALLAQAEGDQLAHANFLAQARELSGPDETGYSLLYGVEVAHFQFLHAKIRAVLLPQLAILSPAPELRDLLWPVS